MMKSSIIAAIALLLLNPILSAKSKDLSELIDDTNSLKIKELRTFKPKHPHMDPRVKKAKIQNKNENLIQNEQKLPTLTRYRKTPLSKRLQENKDSFPLSRKGKIATKNKMHPKLDPNHHRSTLSPNNSK